MIDDFLKELDKAAKRPGGMVRRYVLSSGESTFSVAQNSSILAAQMVDGRPCIWIEERGGEETTMMLCTTVRDNEQAPDSSFTYLGTCVSAAGHDVEHIYLATAPKETTD